MDVCGVLSTLPLKFSIISSDTGGRPDDLPFLTVPVVKTCSQFAQSELTNNHPERYILPGN
jgi:hypothetical protein